MAKRGASQAALNLRGLFKMHWGQWKLQQVTEPLNPLFPDEDDLPCTLNDEFWHLNVNKDVIWHFSKGSSNKLYRQSSLWLTSDTHSVILFWKQAWNVTETTQFKKGMQRFLLVGV